MGRAGPDEFAPMKLTPEMASFNVLVLTFVTDYIVRHQISPSQREIIEALASNRSRVREAIRRLVREGLLLKAPGERGLALPSDKDAAVRLLRKLGWTLADGVLAPPRGGEGAARPIYAVPEPFELDYP